MVSRISAAAAAIGFASVIASSAAAQTVPNLGNYQALNDSFRIGIRVTNSANGFDQSASFQQPTIDEIADFLDPSEIAAVVGFANAQTGAISQVFDLRGATALGGYLQGGTELTVSVVSPTGQIINQSNGAACPFAFDDGSRQASFDIFDEAVDDETTPTARALFGCLSRAFAQYSPVDPLAGNPGSLQASMTRSALDLTSADSLVEDDANTAGDPWIVGAVYTGGSAGRFDISRVDGRIQRSFRLFEGNRALLKIDIPINYSRINKTKAYSAQFNVGLEVPLIAQRWSLEPRIAYGAVYSADAGSAGTILQGSIASRFVIQGLGRGRLVIGNMIGYSTTLDIPGTDIEINPDLKNWSFRNGLAYELPLKMRIGGRGSSIRGSYSFTAYAGDQLRNNSFHEATLSFGLRGREESTRATRDLIRFNVSTVQARGYRTYTAGLGFRF